MMQAALVLPETTVGMIEASATRKATETVDAQLGVDHRHGVGRGAHHAAAARVEDGRAALAGVGEHVLVAHLVGAGLDLLGDVGLERFRGGEAAREAQALDNAAAVGLGGEVVGDDRGMHFVDRASGSAPCRGFPAAAGRPRR